MKRCAAAYGLLFALTAAILPAAAQGQGGPGGGRRGQMGLRGRVTAKGENTLDVQRMGRGGQAGDTIKVTVEKETKIARLEQGAAADLTENYLVVVAGDRDGGKVAAKGILRLSKIEEKANLEEARAGFMLGMFMNRMLGRRPQPGQGGQGAGGFAALMPVVGKLVSTQPLTVETIPIRPDQQAEKIEVQGADAARILRMAEAKLDDIKVDGNVLVIPKDGAEGQAVTARAVVALPQMPAPGQQQGQQQ